MSVILIFIALGQYVLVLLLYICFHAKIIVLLAAFLIPVM